ncbi:hypothetical protein [Pseudoalteromonas rubra]|uniref:hypothetical protein n=2 Tax=Pseudoalteromonas TaxID=53246 RepID=UPI002DBF1C27|nr:hypothetical protein [Pseudoalteromonas rubra]MEC4087254.1 hypothetical protein [Pseudoalteromonas rubra]
MPAFIKFLWLIGLSSLVYGFSVFEYADSIGELTEFEKLQGEIRSVECKEGSRSFMQKKLTFFTDKSGLEMKFSKEGECSQLVAFYENARSFEAVQRNTLLKLHVFSLKVDGIEQYDFAEQKSDYNLYIIFSLFITPLIVAICATVNWSRGRRRQ